MFQIQPFEPADLPAITAFVEAIQEHERVEVPELKPGVEIAPRYAWELMCKTAERNGALVVAKVGEKAVGFVCAWIDEDDDPLLREEARRHVYISDIFVSPEWRRKGIGRRLLESVETTFRQQGCRRLRICSKAVNHAALKFYQAADYKPYEVVLSKLIA